MQKIWSRLSGMTSKPEARKNPGRDQALIRLMDVSKEFQTGAGAFLALDRINLTITRGEFVAVVGKSGSGKTTLLNMITGIDRPTSGEIFVAGAALHKMNEGQMAVWRGNAVGIVFQFFQLFPTLTVLENILLPMDFCHFGSPGHRRERALALLEQVDMLEQQTKLPSALSGGQQQRVAIARALANDPPLLIADEPTGNLDSHSSAAIFSLFEQLVSQNKTVIMVTHDQDLARKIPRAIYLADGRVVSDTNRPDVSPEPEVPVVEGELQP